MTSRIGVGEAQTGEQIDVKLLVAGCVIQDKNRINLIESLGVAVSEMDADTDSVDYAL